MYSEPTSILDALFFHRRNKISTILIILLISAAFTWYFTLKPMSGKTEFVAQQGIQVSQNKNSVEYGANEDALFALLSETYFKIPKTNNCVGFDPYDFTTWCDEWSAPIKY